MSRMFCIQRIKGIPGIKTFDYGCLKKRDWCDDCTEPDGTRLSTLCSDLKYTSFDLGSKIGLVTLAFVQYPRL